LNRYSFTLRGNLKGYAEPNNYNAIAKIITEAWVWLEKEGLIAPDPGQTGEWIFITRRGRKFRETTDVRNFKAASLLPDETLDPKLASKVSPPFLRGDYDTAIFEAFKEVEIRVRNLAGADKTDIGVNLMRKAFYPQTGPLTDSTQVPSEQQAISDLFAGAIGCFKNPSSHRDVDFYDPAEVIELIMLADQLIRIAERRKP
ncbi:TIGR02391 family protein, partial [bacterium]|nr:TIGR02391 family protein [bacterium]